MNQTELYGSIMDRYLKTFDMEEYYSGIKSKAPTIFNDIMVTRSISPVMSYEFKDITVYNNRCIAATFADGTVIKSVCSEEDTFNFEYGLYICLSKKIADGTLTPDGVEYQANILKMTKKYAKAVKNGIKLYNRKIAEKEKQEKLEEDRELVRQRRIDRNRLKKVAKKNKSKPEESLKGL